MAKITEITREFMNKYKHLTLDEYLNTQIVLDIPAKVANVEEYGAMKDVTGRMVDIGDVIAIGHSRYIDVRVAVVIGYTPKTVKICEFNDVNYGNTTGLAFPTSIGGKFVIVKKKMFRKVD